MSPRPANPQKSVRASLQLRTLLQGRSTVVASFPTQESKSNSDRQKLALRWQYIVRQRERWSNHPTSRRAITELAQESLEELGIGKAFYDSMLNADKFAIDDNSPPTQWLEVAIPWKSETIDWDLRILPWEHLLSAATRDLRDEVPIAIVRHLALPKRRRVSSQTGSPCLVRGLRAGRKPSSPYLRSISHTLQTLGSSSDPSNLLDLQSLTAEACANTLSERRPDWLHLSGIQYPSSNSDSGRGDSPEHGYLFGTSHETSEWLYPMAFAKTLNPTGRPLRWLTLDFYNSASRIAPLAIVQGARHALGFEHGFDEKAAELLFMRLYQSLAADPSLNLLAFTRALQEIKSEADRIRGCGVVLWSDRSLLEEAHRLPSAKPTPIRVFGSSCPAPPFESINLSPVQWVSVEVEPEPKINYALLHNRYSILRKLSLRLNLDHQADFDEVRNLQVLVQLETGSPQIPFQTQVTLSRHSSVVHLVNNERQPWQDSAPRGIHIPLLSTQLRSLRETIQSSILVQVRWQDALLYSHTFPVDLCPIGEWRYGTHEISLLPSFVLPTDPIIPSIIQSAQPFLACLQDSYQAGFDGTQGVSGQDSSANRWLPIDDQVRAIWSSLALTRSLHYINPPPSYGDYVQRLRTPTQVLREGRGTCIDLAILVASCLEWIDLPSVIFLLDDHAFPGYWRDLDAMIEFNQPRLVDDDSVLPSFRNSIRPKSDAIPSCPLPWWPNSRSSDLDPESFSSPWFFDRSTYREIRELVLSRKLIPIETTALARKAGFFEACEEAIAYFQNKTPRRFHSMLDITRSRSSVTPLPMLEVDSSIPFHQANDPGGANHGD